MHFLAQLMHLHYGPFLFYVNLHEFNNQSGVEKVHSLYYRFVEVTLFVKSSFSQHCKAEDGKFKEFNRKWKFLNWPA